MTSRLLAGLAAAALLATPAGCQRNHKRGVTVEGRDADAAASPGAGRPFPRVEADQVTGLRIERQGQPAVVLRRSGDGWRLEAPVRAAADARALQFALAEIAHLEFDPAPVSTDRAAWAGLTVDPSEVVTLRVSVGELELPALHVGRQRYLRIGDADAVWKLHHLDHYTFDRELRLWKDRNVLRIDAASVTGLEVVDDHGRRAAASRTTTPAPDDQHAPAEQWTLTSGRASVGGELDPEAPAGLLSHLLELDADDQAAVGAAEAGLTPPRLLIRVLRGDGPPVELRLGARGKTTTYIAVGGDDPRIWSLANSTADLLYRPPMTWRVSGQNSGHRLQPGGNVR